MPTVYVDVSFAANRAGGACAIGLRGTLTMSGDNYVTDNQNIGTSAEAISVGDVTGTDAFMILHNTDPANYCTLYANGATGTHYAGLLRAGQFAVLFGNSSAIGAKADTSGIVLAKYILENTLPTTGSLVRYNPSMPESGYAVARAVASVTIGSSTLAFEESYTETIDASGFLDVITYSTIGEDCWPSTPPGGGDAYGTLMGVNLHATEVSTVFGSSTGFARIPAKSGFLLIPINANVNLGLNSGGSHTESRITSRVTLP